jgi:hypothetical protein
MQNKTLNDLSGSPILVQNEEKILYLEERIKKLGDICNELNPYQPVAESFQARLREFNILEFSDPFKITNALLMLLEDTIDELHILKPFNDN